MKVLRATIATGGFVGLLSTFYYVHVTFFTVNVVFYSSLLDAVLAAMAAAGLLFLLRYFDVLGSFEKLQLVVIWLLVGYAFAISIPTVIDRSLSLYILEKIQQRGGGIRFDRFEEVFTLEYLKEHHVMEIRLTEQVESGTVVIENGCVRLTYRGRVFATLSRTFRKHLLPKRRLLLGIYTDDLVDPFRHGQASPGYECS
ncbi:MAG: hypothetical protein O7H39_01130 [Gammaproteobacteria bacterium]|nr:hypothetical protein [Gammaproteobacteria bacterium]